MKHSERWKVDEKGHKKNKSREKVSLFWSELNPYCKDLGHICSQKDQIAHSSQQANICTVSNRYTVAQTAPKNKMK